VLLHTRVDKPALLRRPFELGCAHSGQVLSFTKMMGSLQHAGTITTLAHSVDLLASAGMLTGLQNYAGDRPRTRASSPKLQAFHIGIVTARKNRDPKAGDRLLATEVTSGRARDTHPSLAAFAEAFGPYRTLIVGADGVGLATFLDRPVTGWLGRALRARHPHRLGLGRKAMERSEGIRTPLSCRS
jgi:uncharacterized protein